MWLLLIYFWCHARFFIFRFRGFLLFLCLVYFPPFSSFSFVWPFWFLHFSWRFLLFLSFFTASIFLSHYYYWLFSRYFYALFLDVHISTFFFISFLFSFIHYWHFHYLSLIAFEPLFHFLSRFSDYYYYHYFREAFFHLGLLSVFFIICELLFSSDASFDISFDWFPWLFSPIFHFFFWHFLDFHFLSFFSFFFRFRFFFSDFHFAVSFFLWNISFAFLIHFLLIIILFLGLIALQLSSAYRFFTLPVFSSLFIFRHWYFHFRFTLQAIFIGRYLFSIIFTMMISFFSSSFVLPFLRCHWLFSIHCFLSFFRFLSSIDWWCRFRIISHWLFSIFCARRFHFLMQVIFSPLRFLVAFFI